MRAPSVKTSRTMHLAVIDTFDSSIRAWGAQHAWPIEHLLRLLLAGLPGGCGRLVRESSAREGGGRTNNHRGGRALLVMGLSNSRASLAQPPDYHEPMTT